MGIGFYKLGTGFAAETVLTSVLYSSHSSSSQELRLYRCKLSHGEHTYCLVNML